MNALHVVSQLDLPGWLIAAGFVRNLIWDELFNLTTDLNDIDVIYYDAWEVSRERDILLENDLLRVQPNLPWSVKNQARMHLKNGDAPYQSSKDAMNYWPEKQTSIGVKLDRKGNIVISHCFDLAFQFNGCINHNPARSIQVFNKRVQSKGWLDHWPALKISA